MAERLIIETVEPSAFAALMQLEEYLKTISISKKSMLLMKIKASQINNCSYCIALHCRHALAAGETTERLEYLKNWHDRPNIFTEEEKLLLTITEEITLIHYQGLTDSSYAKARKLFDEKFIAQIIMIIIVINSWNRLAIALQTKFQ